MTCGQRIKEERERRHWSQEQLAEQLEVSRQAVSKWEVGQSRPTRKKLARLSQLFDLPPETWDPPPPPEQTSLRRWKGAALALGAALCAVLTLGFCLWPRPEPPGELPPPPEDTSYMFPETLLLESQPESPETLSPAENVPAEPEMEDILAIQQFPDSSWLMIQRGNPVRENRTTFYTVWALYTKSILSPEPWTPLGKLAGDNHYVGNGLDSMDYFTDVLGHEGWKVTLSQGAACVTSWYFYVTPEDGEIHLLLEASGMTTPTECDVDGDGQKEIVTAFGLPMGWQVYDNAPGGGLRRSTVFPQDYGQMPLCYSPKRGFAVTDSVGNMLARYLLDEAGGLRRQPQTDFSLSDYSDAAKTRLTFLTEDPDQVLWNGRVRITPRQQAYLALQELYGLTGQIVPEAYCAVTAEGTVSFSADPEGTQEFFRLDWGPDCGGAAETPGFSLEWFADWSPLDITLSAWPETGGSVLPEYLLAWQYRRLNRLGGRELVNVVRDPEDADMEFSDGPIRYALYLADGTCCRALMQGNTSLLAFSLEA